MPDSDDRLSRFMTEFGPQRDVESRRVLSTLRQRLFDRGEGVRISRFESLERIGHGGMGVVYRAWDPTLKRRVAIKVLHPKNAESILGEARALARLSHPNIVQVLDVGREGAELFIVMEYVGGRTLSDLLARGTPLGKLEAVLEHVADGLEAAHASGVVHHDIKPSNVLISEDGTPQIADFGLARILREEGSSVGGTRGFAAPEQLAGQASDARADVYALTAIVHAITYGRPPLLDVTHSQGQVHLPSRPVVSARLKRFLRRGLALDPMQRLPSVAAWRNAFRRALRSPLRTAAPWMVGVACVSALSFGFLSPERPGPCEGSTALWEPWNRQKRSAVEERLQETGLPYATDAYSEVDRKLSEVSRAWLDTRSQACAASNTAALACTTAQRAGLEEYVSWLSRIEPDEVARVADSLRGLPDPSACTESKDDSPPPELAPFDASLARARAMHAAGRYDDARDLLRSMPLSLETRRYAHRLASHAFALARALNRTGDYPGAAQEFEKAYLLDLLAERESMSAQAAARLAALQASELASPEAARRWIRNAHTALERSNASASARAHVARGIAGAYYALGSFDEAIVALQHANASLPPDDPERIRMGTVLAGIRYQQGDVPAALDAQRAEFAGLKRILGERHPDLIAPMSNIAILYAELGQDERAVASFERAVALAEDTLGADHIQTAVTRGSAAAMLLGRGQPEKCIAMFERTLRVMEATFGPTHPRLISPLQGLASAHLEAGHPEDGERVILRALDTAKHDETLEPRLRIGVFITYAMALRMQARTEDALAAARSALVVVEDSMGPKHPQAIPVRLELAKIHTDRGERKQAQAQYSACLELARTAFGPEHPETVRIQGLLDTVSALP